MRFLLTTLVFFVSVASGFAQWALSGREPLPSTSGVQFAHVRMTNSEGGTAQIHVVTFRSKTHSLVVIDDTDGSADLASGAQSKSAVAAVNGGYFHPDRVPLGLVIVGGKTLHPLERAKLLSGLVVSTGDGVALRRIGEFKPNAAIKSALQAGPFLVDGGKPVSGLNASRSAARTVVCTTSDGRIALVTCRYASLVETAQILLTPGLLPEGGKIVRALNLDGGSSTGLWVRNPDGEAYYDREGKDVRNYVAVVPRTK